MTAIVFDTLSPLNGGLPGTAPEVFVASCDQLAADLLLSGSMAALVLAGKLKLGDVLFVNYDVDGTLGSGVYRVNSTGGGSLSLVI